MTIYILIFGKVGESKCSSSTSFVTFYSEKSLFAGACCGASSSHPGGVILRHCSRGDHTVTGGQGLVSTLIEVLVSDGTLVHDIAYMTTLPSSSDQDLRHL